MDERVADLERVVDVLTALVMAAHEELMARGGESMGKLYFSLPDSHQMLHEVLARYRRARGIEEVD